MTVLIFLKFLDFEQVSVDSEMPILGQARSGMDHGKLHVQFERRTEASL